MRDKTFFAVIGIAVTVTAIFGATLKVSLDDSDVAGFDSPFKKEHYQIQITGMKNVYRVGERYDFSYIISGYGHECGPKKVIFPDENGDTTGIYSSSSCIANVPMKDFVFDAQKERGATFGHISLKKARHYIVAVEFEHGSGFEPTQKGHDFFVVENICNDIADSKRQAQCLSDSFDSCKSAYMTQSFSETNGGTVSVVAVVESWNDCHLTIYTENSLGEHTPYNGIRSTCKEMTVEEDALLFEGCNNADYPPIPLQCRTTSNATIQMTVQMHSALLIRLSSASLQQFT
jgi:hypothetical protein